eukprot:m.696699 g.696699  ORF g.696699 m.696699 type:complete len:112 (-) comp22895_c0_seq5:2155-2490(-)
MEICGAPSNMGTPFYLSESECIAVAGSDAGTTHTNVYIAVVGVASFFRCRGAERAPVGVDERLKRLVPRRASVGVVGDVTVGDPVLLLRDRRPSAPTGNCPWRDGVSNGSK